MMFVIINLLILGALTIICEYLWLKKIIVAETSRKIMHIIGGVLTASWPLYMTWREIQIIIVISLSAIIFLRFTGTAKSFFAVKRKTIGDILGPLTIGVLAFFNPAVVLFVFVVLHIALADGLAAVIGTRYGTSNSYNVFGCKKSISGTLTFAVVSFMIVFGVFSVGSFEGVVSPFALIVIPLVAAAVENLGVYGIDNTLVAVSVGILGRLFNFY